MDKDRKWTRWNRHRLPPGEVLIDLFREYSKSLPVGDYRLCFLALSDILDIFMDRLAGITRLIVVVLFLGFLTLAVCIRFILHYL